MGPYKGICEDGHIMIQARERNFTNAHRNVKSLMEGKESAENFLAPIKLEFIKTQKNGRLKAQVT